MTRGKASDADANCPALATALIVKVYLGPSNVDVERPINKLAPSLAVGWDGLPVSPREQPSPCVRCLLASETTAV